MTDWLKLYIDYLRIYKGNTKEAKDIVVGLMIRESTVSKTVAYDRLERLIKAEEQDAKDKLEAFGGDVMEAEEYRTYTRRRSE